MRQALAILIVISMVLGCSNSKPSSTATTKKQISTFQENNAEEAMNFYVGLFENSEILNIKRYGKDGPAKEGTIKVASFRLNGKECLAKSLDL